VWDPGATPETVIAARRVEADRNMAEPGTPPPTWIALQAGRCLGYVTTIPVRFWDGRRDLPAYLIKGLMVLPEFRSGPIGYHVLKSAASAMPRTAGLAVAPPARRLFEALGYTDLGAVPNWIRPLRAHRIVERLDLTALGLTLPRAAGALLGVSRATGLARIAGWTGSLALQGTAAAVRLAAGSFETRVIQPGKCPKELDRLWAASRERYHSAVVRNAAYLQHRYPVGDGSPYLWAATARRGTLAGIAVLRRPRPDGDERLRGIRIATLADVLYHPDQPAAALSLLGQVERLAREVDADAVLASTSAPAFAGVLKRQWYLPLSGNVHLLLRDVTPEAAGFGRALSEWWISRGDGQADDAF
jgi:hypothetical protein